ncbi:efflux RND transporter periplasmic adaptor subunit [Alsobacter sp. KACC 23698]|uniref:Efflux RND transporter periplasmic adaptor subunit n=1 Tax=Alsobacter sp. KACC 23698 TaxID=3149229 RepID=A0AAU7JH89_9HYPH
MKPTTLVHRCVATLLIGLGAWPLAAAAQTGGPPTVSVAKPYITEIIERDDFTGRFEAVDQVDVRARVTGYLTKVDFRDGSMVKAGDLLLSIDDRPYRDAVKEAEATLVSAKTRTEFAQSDYERAENLRKTGNIADQVFDQRRQALLAARAEADRAEATLSRARLDLEFTQVRAPMSGRISRRLVSEGNLVNANDTLLTNIVSLDPIQFYFDIDERSFLAYFRQGVNGIGSGQGGDASKVAVALTNETEPTHPGRIDFVDNRVDAASGTMRVRASLPNPTMALTPGLFGRIQIQGSQPYKAVMIPDEAIGADQDRRIVYVVGADNKVSAKAIRTGPRIDGLRVVREGLDGSETIVVSGLMRVRPGAAVQPRMVAIKPGADTIAEK